MKIKYAQNAVAPDWNLKYVIVRLLNGATANAVAPDWNLKVPAVATADAAPANAVAPDWNLKKVLLPRREFST